MPLGEAIADAWVRIRPDTDEFRGKLRGLSDEGGPVGADTATRFGTAFKSGLATVAKTAAVAFTGAFAGGVLLGKAAVDQASSLGESLNAVQVTYGAASGEILKLGENAARSVGLSNSQFNMMAVGMAAFAEKIAGPGGDVAGVVDGLSTRIADFASVMNLEVPDAAEKFRAGLAGETEPLRAFGIDISDAAIKTYAYANGIAAAGAELTEQQKIQARYGSIMEQTNKTAGDFANTSDSLANRQRILKAELADAGAKIGQALLPAISGVVGFMADRMIPVLTRLGGIVFPALVEGWEYFVGGLTGEFTNEGSGVLLFLNRLGMRVRDVADWLADNWPTMRRIAGAVLGGIVDAAGVLWRFFTDKVIPILETVVDIVRSNWPTIQRVAETVFSTVSTVVGGAINAIATAVPPLIEAFRSITSWIVDNEPILLGLAAGIATVVVGAIIAWTTATWANVSAQLGLAVAWATANAPLIALVAGIAALTAAVVWAYENVDWFRESVDAIGRFFRDKFLPILQDVWGWLRDNVPKILQAVWEWLKNVWDRSEGIRGFLADAFKVAWEVLRTTVQTVIDTIIVLWGWVKDVWDRSEGLRGFLADAFKLAWEVAKGAVEGLVGAFRTAWEWAQTIWDRTEGLRGFLAGAFSAGWGIAVAAVDGLVSMFRDAFDWAQNVWDRTEKLRAFFADLFAAGVRIARDVIGEVVDKLKAIFDWAQNVWDRTEMLRSFFVGAFKSGVQAAVDILGKIVSVLVDIIEKAKEAWEWLEKVNPFSSGSAGDFARRVAEERAAGGDTGGGGRTGGGGTGGIRVAHAGGWIPGFPSQEVPAILRGGERVLNPYEAERYEAGRGPSGGVPWQGPSNGTITLIIEGRPFTAIIEERDAENAQRLLAGAAT